MTTLQEQIDQAEAALKAEQEAEEAAYTAWKDAANKLAFCRNRTAHKNRLLIDLYRQRSSEQEQQP